MTDEERKQFINEYCRNVGNIKIKCDDCKFVEDCVDYGWDGCRKFTPAPSKPMTEQEYIQSCNTEQLAKTLYDIRYDYQVPWKNKGVMEWLKQPHTTIKE